MAPRLALKSVASTAVDAVHAELSKFVESRNPGIVNKQPGTVEDFDRFLETIDLQETNALVTDFLDNAGKRLAAEFLEAKDARLIRSFPVLYCAQHTKERHIGLGKATIFLALGPLSCKNGLPRFQDESDILDIPMESGDALVVGNDRPQLVNTHEGGGFALVSEWTSLDN